MRFPGRGKKNPGIIRIHRDVNRARLVSLVQDQLPVLAAVCRAVYAPFGVGSEGVTHGSNINNVGVFGVYPDLTDVSGVFQSNVCPCSTCIGGSVDPVTVRDVYPNRGLSGTGIDNIGVAFGHGQRTDRCAGQITVRDTLPVGAPVGRFPYAPGAGPEVKRHLICWVSSHGDHPPPAGWSYASPLQFAGYIIGL